MKSGMKAMAVKNSHSKKNKTWMLCLAGTLFSCTTHVVGVRFSSGTKFRQLVTRMSVDKAVGLQQVLP